MKRIQAYKYELMPNGQQTRQMMKFACVQCGYQNNADIVGAINVLKRGEAILAAVWVVQKG